MENKKQSGFTLVELIVSFAVFSILLGAVAVLLPSFLNQYNNVQSTSRTQTTGNTLMEMIEGQLSYATSSINLNTEDNDDFTVVEYDDQDGNAVYLSVLTEAFKTKYGYENEDKLSNGLFVLRYAEANDSEDIGLVSRKAIDWGYTDDFYINNKVTAFTVKKAGSDYRENVLEVSFTLTNNKNGMKNTFTRLVECTNFAATVNNDITIDGADPISPDVPDDTEAFPVVDSYWPNPDSYSNEWTGKSVNAGGIFKYSDGNYYVVYKYLGYVSKNDAKNGPGSFSWGVAKITGTIYTYEELLKLNNVPASQKKEIIYRGDICIKDGVYYVFYATSQTQGEYIPVDLSSWYRIPN